MTDRPTPEDRPAISVVIPTFNGASTLAETLRSILSQSVAGVSITVCDDRSDDDTRTIARTVGGDRVRIVENSERLGLAGNWNRCVEMAESPFVAIFHQDDVMRPGHLEAHERLANREPDLGWIASASGVIDKHGREVAETVVGRGGLGPIDKVFGIGEAIGTMAVENPLRCSAVTLSKIAHRDVGGFDPSFRYVVDWDFWIRVARRFRVAWLAEPTVAVRWHLGSETHRFATGLTDLEETERLLDTLGAEGRPVRAEADHRLSRAYLNRAYLAGKSGNHALARKALQRSLQIWPGICKTIAKDPKLALRLARAWLP